MNIQQKTIFVVIGCVLSFAGMFIAAGETGAMTGVVVGFGGLVATFLIALFG